MPRALVHARMQPHLNGFYSQRLTVQLLQQGLDSAGQRSDAPPTVLGGHADIPCALGVIDPRRFESKEMRQANLTATNRQFHAALQGHWPSIRGSSMAALVGTEQFNILAVEHDLLRVTTRLLLERVEV